MRILIFVSFAVLALVGCSGHRGEARVPGSAVQRVSKKASAWDPSLWPHQRPGAIDPDPAVTYGRLENGMAYAILPNDTPKGHVSVHLCVRSGSVSEDGPLSPQAQSAVDAGQEAYPHDERGVLHLLEHLSFFGGEYFDWSLEATKRGGTNPLVEVLQRAGMAFGPHTNAFTSYDRVVYMLDGTQNTPTFVTTLLKAMHDFAGGLKLKPEAIEKERPIVLSEKRQRDTPDYQSYRAEMEFLFSGSRVAGRSPIGSDRVIHEVTHDTVQGLYKRLYRPDNMMLVVVGAVDVAALEQQIQTLFGDLKNPSSALPKLDYGQAPLTQDLRVGVHVEAESPQVSVNFYQLSPYEPKVETLAQHNLQIKRTLAKMILMDRMVRLIAEEGSPFLSGSFEIYNFINFVQGSEFSIDTKPEYWEKALELGERTLRQALEYGFSQAECDRATKAVLNQMEEIVRCATTRPTSRLATSLVASFFSGFVFESPEQQWELLKDFLAKVSCKDIEATFREAWSLPGTWIFVSGNLPPLQGNSEDYVAALYRRSQKTAVEPWKDAPLKPWAYENWGPAGDIVKRDYREDLGVTQLTFANNTRVTLKPMHFQSNQVALECAVGGGLLDLPGEDRSLIALYQNCYLAGGLEAHSLEDLKLILKGRPVGWATLVDEDGFVYSSQTTRSDLKTNLQLFCAALMAPGYRPESLRIFHKNMDLLYDNLPKSIEYTKQITEPYVLHNKDPRFEFPSKEQLYALNLSDLKNWVQKPLQSGYLELAIVGDYDLEEAVACCANTVGALNRRDPSFPAYPQCRPVSFPKASRPELVPIETRIQNAFVSISWKGNDGWNPEEVVGMEVLVEVIKDRLRLALREEMGAAYNPGAKNLNSYAFPGYGYISAFSYANPLDVEAVTERMAKETKRIADAGVTAEELERNLNPILARLKEARRSNAHWANNLLGAHRHPEFLDWLRAEEARYKAVTTDQLQALAKQYLNWDNAVVLWYEPEIAPEDLKGGF